MSMPAETTGLFNYIPATHAADTHDRAALAAAGAVEPILQRWRHRCSPGLIDASGKIRRVFTRLDATDEDNVSRVIREINEIPEALAELEAALKAQDELAALNGHAVAMPVRNARLLNNTSLHTNGFRLEQHDSRVADWSDDHALREVYYGEIAALVKQVLGATHAFGNNHLRRQSEPAVGGNGPLAKLMSQSRGPVQSPHNDFTESYGDGIVKTVASGGVPHTQTFGLSEAILQAGLTAEDLARKRMLVVNTWRSVGDEPLRRFPLALADRRTVHASCLQTSLIGKIPSGEPRGGIEVFGASYDAAHEWFYYPEMTPGEVLLWKGYDSAEVPAQPTLHTAFDDPATPPDAPERTSIEVRVLCLLDPD